MPQLTECHIVILDGIHAPTQYRNSSNIAKEINRHKPDLRFKHIYQLPAGGIAIHCATGADRDIALQRWSTSAFNSPCLTAHLPTGNSAPSAVTIRNLSNCPTYSDIIKADKETTGDNCQVHRFNNFRQQRVNYIHCKNLSHESFLCIHPCEPRLNHQQQIKPL